MAHNSDQDDKKRDEVLRRMLNTPPKRHDGKEALTERKPEKKPGGRPAKKDHPEA